MKLLSIQATHFRCLRQVEIPLGDLNVFIGANGSGKSTILDALRFLHEAFVAHDFQAPVFSRGGIVHLAWKGQSADEIKLVATFKDGSASFEWSVQLTKERAFDFAVQEHLLAQTETGQPPIQLLTADRGIGRWWSGERQEQVKLAQQPTACALAAAAADAGFPARHLAESIGRWGFFDPNAFLLRRSWSGFDAARFDAYGRNLADRLYTIKDQSPETFDRIVEATRSVLGLPASIEPRESDDRFYLVQHEEGLQYPVHQMGASSGTLRLVALMTALVGETGASLVGIEEPENNIHPTALASFVEHLLDARQRLQLLVTTHSPLLLNYLNEPEAIRVVRNNEGEGTSVSQQNDASAVRQALSEAGFGLGEFYETTGFGS